MKLESGPTPNRPSTREMIVNYTLPGAWEATKRWLPRISGNALLRAMSLAPTFSIGSALLPHLTFAQEQPAGQTEQALANERDYGFTVASNLPEFIPTEALADVNPAEAPKYRTNFPFYNPEVKFVERMGFVATDNLRITHVYDNNSGEWTELEKYLPVGTAQERMNRNLLDLLGTNKTTYGEVNNPLGLDPNEVALYIETGNAEGFKSFRILPNSKGEPAIPLVTGGLYGLRTDLKNIDRIIQAVKIWNETYPDMIDICTTQNGLRAISGDTEPGGIFILHPDYGTTLDPRLGVMLYNEHFNDPGQSNIELRGHIARIPYESRGIYNWRHTLPEGGVWVLHSNDRLSTQYNMDKVLWLKVQIENNDLKFRTKLSRQDYDNLLLWIDSVIDYFTKNPYA